MTLVVSAIFTPISGRLGDMYGKRRIALTVLPLVVAGSVIAALSTSIGPLIVGRRYRELAWASSRSVSL